MLSERDSKFAKAVTDALGLKLVKKLTITFEVNEPVTVDAQFYADGESLDLVCKKFVLSAEGH